MNTKTSDPVLSRYIFTHRLGFLTEDVAQIFKRIYSSTLMWLLSKATVKRLTKHGKIHLKNYICERQKPLKLYLSNQFIKSSVIYQIFARAGKIATSNKTADNAHNVKVTICKQILTMRYGSRLSYEEVALLQ